MRKLKRKIVFLFVLAIIFISMGFYLCYKALYVNTKPSDKYTLPSSSSSTKFISEESIIQKISETSKLVPLEIDLQERILLNNSWGSWDVFRQVKGITFQGKGTYSLDFSKLDTNSVYIDIPLDKIYITLPKPSIDTIAIYEEKTVYETTSNGLLRFGDIRLTPEETLLITKEVKTLMKNQLLEEKFHSLAVDNSVKSLKDLLYPLLPSKSTIIEINFV